VVADAVTCEPVSTGFSLFSGKITGYFAILRDLAAVLQQRSRCAAAPSHQIPYEN
jgi:hypothetical protein